MKISNSKQELARIISDNGGWRDGAEWAAQDKSYCSRKNNVVLYKSKPPKPQVGDSCWGGLPGEMLVELEAGELVRNWHQTILSRAEYFHLYPAPDADGWIEWSGGECPVGEGDRVDVKFSDGDEFFDVGSFWSWGADAGGCNVIAYRLHKTERENPEYCETVMSALIGVDMASGSDSTALFTINAKPTIEQLAADYRNAKDYAARKQQEADDAKADANEALRKLEIAGEALGLLVTPITAKQEPELVITVQVGDEVECVESNIKRDKYNGMVGRLHTIDESDTSTQYLVDFGNEARIWCHEVKFIRRP